MDDVEMNSSDEFVPGELLGTDDEDANDPLPDGDDAANAPVVPVGRRAARAIDIGWKGEMPSIAQPVVDDRVPTFLENLTLEELQIPLTLFKLFVTDKVLSNVAKQTNLYYSQLDVERGQQGTRPWSLLDIPELCAWLGIVVCKSLHPYPSIKQYYSDEFVYSMPQIGDVMALTRFEQIKRYLHLSDRTKEVPRGAAGYNPLYYVCSG